MRKSLKKDVFSRLNLLDLNKTDCPNVGQAERTLSLATGIYMIYRILIDFKKHPFIAIQDAALGGLLIYRGATGVCPIYANWSRNRNAQAILTEHVTTDLPEDMD